MKKTIIRLLLLALFVFGSVAIINYRIEQTQKIDAEAPIVENR